MRIGCAGYFGYGNLGDEWFLRAWREAFAARSVQVEALHPWDDVDGVDAIVIGGGDLIIPGAVNNNYFREEMLRRPVYVYGVGVPQGTWAPEATDFYRDFLSRARSVTVRDAGSAQRLRQHVGVEATVAPDLAWAVEMPRFPMCPPVGRPIVGLSIRPVARYADLTAFVEIILGMQELGLEALLIPLQTPAPPGMEDHSLHQQLQQAVVERGGYCQIAPPDLDLTHRLALIGRCRVYGTMRFHGMIAALRHRVACAALTVPGAPKFLALEAYLGAALCYPSTFAWGHRLADLARGSVEADVQGVTQLEQAARSALKPFVDQVLSLGKGV